MTGQTAAQPSGASRMRQLRPAVREDPEAKLTGPWPLRSFLEPGPLPSAVPCARMHARQRLWEWRLTGLNDTAELVVSELETNAVQVSRADAQTSPVRLWLLADRTRILVQVWDACPLPPVRVSASSMGESGRGLLLVEALSARWNWYFPPQPGGGKVVWALLETP